MKIILQKLIAQTNDYSRRQAEQLIRDGLVVLNGKTAVLGDKADETDKIKVGGQNLKLDAAKKVYIKLNKPAGYTSTTRAFKGEKNILSLVQLPMRLFSVGRLDKDSSGLILLTNDGDFALQLSHPRFQKAKIYEVKTARSDKRPEEIMSALKSGINIGDGDGKVKVKHVKYLQNQTFVITLGEGKKRQIRRMFQMLNIKVIKLHRTEIANIKLGNLKTGQWEYLKPEEIKITNNK
ncbi:MAG: pseudouridine synthase [Patescibacteria group bacterium]